MIARYEYRLERRIDDVEAWLDELDITAEHHPGDA